MDPIEAPVGEHGDDVTGCSQRTEAGDDGIRGWFVERRLSGGGNVRYHACRIEAFVFRELVQSCHRGDEDPVCVLECERELVLENRAPRRV